MRKRGLILGAVVLAAVAVTASAVYANSALQLYQDCGALYIKHVNYNYGDSALTWLLIKNTGPGDAVIEVKFKALAVDGTNVSAWKFVPLRCNETRSLNLYWNKEITDLNFLQLIRKADPRKKTSGT